MIDTSVMVAGLVGNHEFHEIARPFVSEARERAVPGIVLAETWAALRRGPWKVSPAGVEHALAPWAAQERIVTTPAASYVEVLRKGRALGLGGNVHDLLIAFACAAHGLPLATLDRRQATLAETVPALEVRLLPPA